MVASARRPTFGTILVNFGELARFGSDFGQFGREFGQCSATLADVGVNRPNFGKAGQCWRDFDQTSAKLVNSGVIPAKARRR